MPPPHNPVPPGPGPSGPSPKPQQSTNPDPNTGSNPNRATGTTSPNANSGSTVAITASGFSPTPVTAKVGSTVTWTNDTKDVRNVTFDDTPALSADIPAGQSFSHTVTAAGSHHYHCKYHPDHTGVIEAK